MVAIIFSPTVYLCHFNQLFLSLHPFLNIQHPSVDSFVYLSTYLSFYLSIVYLCHLNQLFLSLHPFLDIQHSSVDSLNLFLDLLTINRSYFWQHKPKKKNYNVKNHGKMIEIYFNLKN